MNPKRAASQIRLNEWAAIIKDYKVSEQAVEIYCEDGLKRSRIAVEKQNLV